MTHTRNVPTIAHWRTPPRNAPTSRDLHDGISGKWQAQHWTQQSVHMLIEQKIVLKLPRTGENELLPGKEGHTMSATLVQAASGDLKRRQCSTGGVSEVRDAMWGWCAVCRMRRSAPERLISKSCSYAERPQHNLVEAVGDEESSTGRRRTGPTAD